MAWQDRPLWSASKIHTCQDNPDVGQIPSRRSKKTRRRKDASLFRLPVGRRSACRRRLGTPRLWREGTGLVEKAGRVLRGGDEATEGVSGRWQRAWPTTTRPRSTSSAPSAGGESEIEEPVRGVPGAVVVQGGDGRLPGPSLGWLPANATARLLHRLYRSVEEAQEDADRYVTRPLRTGAGEL